MKYSLCIDMLFSKFDFYDRFARARKCGGSAVEFWKWSNKDISRVESLIEENCLELSVFNLDSKNEQLSDELSRGILNSGRKDEFISAIEESIPVYKKLDAKAMIVLIGEKLDISYEKQIENITECLLAASKVLKQEKVNLVVEPLNDIDRKNYFLPRSAEVFEIIRDVDCSNIKVLLDLYHEQLMAGNLINTIEKNISNIGHIHIADVPGRHEPGTGEINFANVIKTIENSGYKRYIGLEYRATKPEEEMMEFIVHSKLGGVKM